MKIANRQFVAPVLKFAGGFSLSEMLVVISVIVLLIGIGIPAARQITDSFESSAGLKNVISAALSNARAIATKNQKYAGLRFQQDQNGRGYMIFIVHDPAKGRWDNEIDADPGVTGAGLANGFRAVKGLKPVKLPANAGVMDLRIRLNLSNEVDPSDTAIAVAGDGAASNANIDDVREVTDTTTFSIIFSPSGKLVIHDVRIRNRHGRTESTVLTESARYSNDDVFNTYTKITRPSMPYGRFFQDDYAIFGLGQEHSRNSFVIYDKRAFAAVDTSSRWTDYLSGLEVLYINSYTGEIINK